MKKNSLCSAMLVLVGCSSGGGSGGDRCVSGETRCSGSSLLTCNSNGTGYTEKSCSYGCSDDACRTCMSGDARCEGSRLLTCSSDGSGWEQETCPAGCDARNLRCKTETCTPGERICSGSILKVCEDDGSGYDTTSCPYGCNTVTDRCKNESCTPGTKSCVGRTLVTCKSDGSGLLETECPKACDDSVVPARCSDSTSCSAGKKRCSPTNPKQVEVCRVDGSGWTPGPLCTTSCMNGSCQNCTTGEETCTPVSFHRSEIDRCKADGTWQKAAEVCTAGSCVMASGTTPQFECGTCWEGERSCAGDSVTECTSPSTGPTTVYACPGETSCVVGSCAPTIWVDLEGAQNYRLVAQAVVDCWDLSEGASADSMCGVFDTTMTIYGISYGQVGGWVCDEATAFDFTAGDSDLERAQDLFGCGTFDLSDVDWRRDPLPAGSEKEVCLWYDSTWGDEIFIEDCDKFWL